MLLVRQQKLGGWANIWRQALIGFIMITLGNGLVGWAEQFVPSGIAALIASLSPLWVILVNAAVNRQDKTHPFAWAGVLVGVLGMVILFKDNIAFLTDPKYITGALMILVAALGWASGGVFIKKQKSSNHPILNAGLQILFGGFWCFILSFLFDDWNTLQWSAEAMGALAYLIVFGSLMAFAAYGYALSKLPITLVSMHAYINPLVAVFLGWLVLGEKVNLNTALAFMLIIGSIYLVNKGLQRQRLAASAAAEAPKPVGRISTLVRLVRSKMD